MSRSPKPHIERYRQQLNSILADAGLVPEIKQIVLAEYLALTEEALATIRARHRKQLPAYTGPIPTEEDIEIPKFLKEDKA